MYYVLAVTFFFCFFIYFYLFIFLSWDN